MRRSIVLLAALVVGGCEIPTEAPRWEQQWQVPVPADSLRVGVAELLPGSMRVSDDGEAFIAPLTGVTGRFALAAMCGACAGVSGATPVKPEFSDTVSIVTPLPEDLVSAGLEGRSALDVGVSHSFDFDPLRPGSGPGAERGWMVIRVTSDGNVVAEDSISGEDTAFPAGTVIRPDLGIEAVQAAGDVSVELSLHSPQGDGATLSAADELVLTLSPTEVRITEATVAMSDLAVGPETRTVSLPVESQVVERVQSGALIADLENPFGVTGDLDIQFGLPSGDIRRTVTFEADEARERVAFTREELQRILGEEQVELGVQGSVSAPDGAVTIRPEQELGLDLQFEVILLVGPQESGS